MTILVADRRRKLRHDSVGLPTHLNACVLGGKIVSFSMGRVYIFVVYMEKHPFRTLEFDTWNTEEYGNTIASH